MLDKAWQTQKVICNRLTKDKVRAKHRKNSERLAKPENPHKKLAYGFSNEIPNLACWREPHWFGWIVINKPCEYKFNKQWISWQISIGYKFLSDDSLERSETRGADFKVQD